MTHHANISQESGLCAAGTTEPSRDGRKCGKESVRSGVCVLHRIDKAGYLSTHRVGALVVEYVRFLQSPIFTDRDRSLE